MDFGPWVLIIFLGVSGHIKIEGIKEHYICMEILEKIIPLTAYKQKGGHVGGICINKKGKSTRK